MDEAAADWITSSSQPLREVAAAGPVELQPPCTVAREVSKWTKHIHNGAWPARESSHLSCRTLPSDCLRHPESVAPDDVVDAGNGGCNGCE